ncbi:MAG TPA: carboxypeptidase-like regulatory domain-containing protein [Vicinamibacterales bacterium]|nr:carboxypeptidase-like regulatory domain-containing protein [Vicinamibacterales bacterium]
MRSILVVCFLGGAWPAMAQGVGAIGGTVTDASGAVLPGVTVTLNNAQGSVGGRQETATDDRGTYQFLRLVPGSYIVKAELQGFRPAEQRDIVVNADVTARADLKLEIGTLAEGVTVSGEAPLLDTTTALKQTVLSRDVLNSMPNRFDVWSVAKVIPAVTLSKVDVGGSEAFLQSGVTVHGSSSEGGYFIDGMDVGQLDGNGAGATMYLDPYAFQETNFQVGGAGTALSNRGGLLFNMITRTGTNQLHGGAMFIGANHGLASASNYSDALKAQILASAPPAALAANPNLSPTADILFIRDTGAWLAGPVKKDKLWFSFSWHDQRLNQHLVGQYDNTGKQVLDDNIMWTTSAKVAWQITRSAQLSYFNNTQYKFIGHRNGGGTFADSAARNLNDKYPTVHQVKFTSPLGTRMVVDITTNRFRADDKFGQRPEVASDAISRFDSVIGGSGGAYTVALPTYRDNAMFREQVFSSLSFFGGGHDVRVGYQYTKGGEKSGVWSTSGMRAVYANGVPTQVNTYNVAVTSTSSKTPVAFTFWDRDTAFYIQDKWNPIRKLVVNLGLRYEGNYGWLPPACTQPNVFLPAQQCYPETKNVPNFHAPTPRLSMIYDLMGDGKTALKFSANRYNQPINQTILARVNPIGTVSDKRAWTVCAPGQTSGCDLNGDGIPQINELGPSSGYPLGTTNRYDPNLKWPISNEYSGEIQQQFPMNLVISVGYTHRVTLRNIALQNLAVPASSYIPLVVTEVSSGKQVTVYNQDPATNGKFDNYWSNRPEEDTVYNGTDVTLNKRMSNHWSLTGGASFGHTKGDQLGGDLNNPNSAQYRYGVYGMDIPWSYRMSGVYELPYQVSVSGTYQLIKGAPETSTVSVASTTVTLTQGTTTVWVAPYGDTRLPNIAQLDMSLRKTWRMGGRTFEPRIDFFNLSNQASIIGRVTQFGPNYDRVSSIQRGRLIKLGFSAEF